MNNEKASHQTVFSGKQTEKLLREDQDYQQDQQDQRQSFVQSDNSSNLKTKDPSTNPWDDQVFNMPFQEFVQQTTNTTEGEGSIMEIQKVYSILTQINKGVETLKSTFKHELQKSAKPYDSKIKSKEILAVCKQEDKNYLRNS